ncbi:ATP-binding protein [Nonomuraea sp. K274]|uniref:ATP-binding protein n=1 Tax=Nonomuraea cypriaca TaxID=1187855 RepID=A0A931A5L3_9ACTN|nr:ATP-binding protein [Nonomuraea cypriaca]MBF8185563.1 ATP-binding protein [Nonomuraea cypriaca]
MNGMAWRGDFPGERVQLPAVRRLSAALLADCPVRDDAISCVVELASNAILHTRSAGGVFTVGIWSYGTIARVAVKDAGGSGEPVVRAGPHLAESGRGLAIVAALCARLGVAGGEGGRVVWADLSCGCAGVDVPWEKVPLLEAACEYCGSLKDGQSRTGLPDRSSSKP